MSWFMRLPESRGKLLTFGLSMAASLGVYLHGWACLDDALVSCGFMGGYCPPIIASDIIRPLICTRVSTVSRSKRLGLHRLWRDGCFRSYQGRWARPNFSTPWCELKLSDTDCTNLWVSMPILFLHWTSWCFDPVSSRWSLGVAAMTGMIGPMVMLHFDWWKCVDQVIHPVNVFLKKFWFPGSKLHMEGMVLFWWASLKGHTKPDFLRISNSET